MNRRPQFLSKSKLMSARQCPKRLYLEIHRPDLVRFSAAAEFAFAVGDSVGEVARDIYGSADSELIPYAGGLGHALRKSRRLISEGPRFPIFEATLQHDGVLVRIDALLPYRDRWQIVEVKASTTTKEDHLYDCAIQCWVFRGLGYPLQECALAHVDNRFVYEGSGDYNGLLIEEDITEEVDRMADLVPAWVSDARKVARGREPDIDVGTQCFSPHECPFVSHCWPMDTEFPLLNLGGGVRKDKLAALVADGVSDVRDIPAQDLNDRQRRIQKVCRDGKAELLPAAADFVASLEFPRYYLDFETIMPAVPVFAGTRPYETLPVQWSCHYEADRDSLDHAEFLDLSGDPPMRRLAESLIRALGHSGPVLTYSPYEERMINGLIERFPDLAEALRGILKRLTDLLPIVRENYYHPAMQGSWSIKAVLPTIGSDLDYKKLEEIQDGTQASAAYLEAINPATPAPRKAELKKRLLDYCRQDTLAMVHVLRFLATA
ncbi:MAG: DUF2779 domain-containing protein [Gammaproteobacteria bacterium]|nr:DUF2779 domain-containing protein [Gammaproteobacteria bacterium]